MLFRSFAYLIRFNLWRLLHASTNRIILTSTTQGCIPQLKHRGNFLRHCYASSRCRLFYCAQGYSAKVSCIALMIVCHLVQIQKFADSFQGRSQTYRSFYSHDHSDVIIINEDIMCGFCVRCGACCPPCFSISRCQWVLIRARPASGDLFRGSPTLKIGLKLGVDGNHFSLFSFLFPQTHQSSINSLS